MNQRIQIEMRNVMLSIQNACQTNHHKLNEYNMEIQFNVNNAYHWIYFKYVDIRLCCNEYLILLYLHLEIDILWCNVTNVILILMIDYELKMCRYWWLRIDHLLRSHGKAKSPRRKGKNLMFWFFKMEKYVC